jgi:hypothetical protein
MSPGEVKDITIVVGIVFARGVVVFVLVVVVFVVVRPIFNSRYSSLLYNKAALINML